jgi:hypothetical protein
LRVSSRSPGPAHNNVLVLCMRGRRRSVTDVPRRDFFFLFDPFGERISLMHLFLERFQKIDPELGAANYGAELTHLGATRLGVDIVGWTVHVVQRGG